MRYIAFCLSLAASALAQDIVVPAGCVARDGRSNGALAGFTQRFRMQILLDATTLTSLQGREVTGFSVRRDGQDLGAQRGGRVHLVVRVSTLAAARAEPSPVFAQNQGPDVVEVLRGTVNIPDSPALPHRDAATWQAPHAVAIDFNTAFTYHGGALCLDLEGTPDSLIPARWWPIDFDLATHDAQVTTLGTSCNPRAQALCSQDALVPGASVQITGTGPDQALAVLMLSGVRTNPPLPLDGIGASGCSAHVVPQLALGTSYSQMPSAGIAAATTNLHLPNSSSLASATLYAQWLAYPDPVNPAQISTTAGLALQIASSRTPIAGAVVRTGPVSVTSTLPNEGRVLPHIVPVLCLRSR